MIPFTPNPSLCLLSEPHVLSQKYAKHACASIFALPLHCQECCLLSSPLVDSDPFTRPVYMSLSVESFLLLFSSLFRRHSCCLWFSLLTVKRVSTTQSLSSFCSSALLIFYYFLYWLYAELILAASLDTPGGHAKRTSELGKGDLGAECEFSAGVTLSHFTPYLTCAAMTCFHSVQFMGLDLTGSVSFYIQTN